MVVMHKASLIIVSEQVRADHMFFWDTVYLLISCLEEEWSSWVPAIQSIVDDTLPYSMVLIVSVKYQYKLHRQI